MVVAQEGIRTQCIDGRRTAPPIQNLYIPMCLMGGVSERMPRLDVIWIRRRRAQGGRAAEYSPWLAGKGEQVFSFGSV